MAVFAWGVSATLRKGLRPNMIGSRRYEHSRCLLENRGPLLVMTFA